MKRCDSGITEEVTPIADSICMGAEGYNCYFNQDLLEVEGPD